MYITIITILVIYIISMSVLYYCLWKQRDELKEIKADLYYHSNIENDIRTIHDNLKMINDALDLHVAIDHHIKNIPEHGTNSTISTDSWAVVCTKDEKGKQTCNFYQLPDEYVYIKNLMNFLKDVRFKIVDTHPQFSQYFYDKYN